ncbi:MAG: YceI family protein, partial [Parvularculaceae bacterium]
HPTIVFKSTQALQSSAGTGKLFGDLTVKGVTKAVVLDVTLNQAGRNPITGKETIGVSAHGRVLRSDWGLDAYVPAVSDELEIRIEAEFEHQD